MFILFLAVLSESRTTAISLKMKGFLFFQGPVTFDEVAVNFTEAEWALLDQNQRACHRDVMEETRENVVSLGEICFPPPSVDRPTVQMVRKNM